MRAEPVGRFEGGARFPRYEGPAGGRFEGGARFGAMAPAAHGFQPRPRHYEGAMRFDGAVPPGAARYEQQAAPPRFDYPGQQATPPRFPPQHGALRPLLYDGPAHAGGGGGGVPQGFVLAPQRFPEPAGSQFQTAPGGFSGQTAFSMAPAAAPFSQPGHAQFYNPGAPLQQPVLMGNMNQNFLQNPVPFGPQAPQENHFGQVDVNDLLSKLISTGIIKPSQPDAATAAAPPAAAEPAAAPAPPPAAEEEEEEEQEEDEDLPDLTGFSIEHMKQRYEGVVSRLYSGNQCCLCSMRFTPAQTDMYADHLDWHFRQNHAGKTAGKKVTHRRWYYGLTDWVEFEEIADLEERAKSQFFEKENEEEVQKSQAAAKEKEFQSVRAAKDQVGELCEICQEPFETYWVEEEEDWFLKNALRVDDKNFHPSCFEDYQNTSSYLDVSPSPGRLQPDFPPPLKAEPEEPQGAEPKAEGAEPEPQGEEPQEAPPQDPDPAPPAPPDLDPPASA